MSLRKQMSHTYAIDPNQLSDGVIGRGTWPERVMGSRYQVRNQIGLPGGHQVNVSRNVCNSVWVLKGSFCVMFLRWV